MWKDVWKEAIGLEWLSGLRYFEKAGLKEVRYECMDVVSVGKGSGSFTYVMRPPHMLSSFCGGGAIGEKHVAQLVVPRRTKSR